MGCYRIRPPLLTGVGPPHQRPLGKIAMLPSPYTDVRSLLIGVLLAFKGRTLNSNSQGTDHGWGGNYWIAGGKVKGKQMLGKYPYQFTEFESDVNVGRGVFLPTTPWESVWNAVGEWLELDEQELKDVIPHKDNFPPADIFTKSQLFEN